MNEPNNETSQRYSRRQFLKGLAATGITLATGTSCSPNKPAVTRNPETTPTQPPPTEASPNSNLLTKSAEFPYGVTQASRNRTPGEVQQLKLHADRTRANIDIKQLPYPEANNYEPIPIDAASLEKQIRSGQVIVEYICLGPRTPSWGFLHGEAKPDITDPEKTNHYIKSINGMLTEERHQQLPPWITTTQELINLPALAIVIHQYDQKQDRFLPNFISLRTGLGDVPTCNPSFGCDTQQTTESLSKEFDDVIEHTQDPSGLPTPFK